jgi:hypothetical protein
LPVGGEDKKERKRILSLKKARIAGREKDRNKEFVF